MLPDTGSHPLLRLLWTAEAPNEDLTIAVIQPADPLQFNEIESEPENCAHEESRPGIAMGLGDCIRIDAAVGQPKLQVVGCPYEMHETESTDRAPDPCVQEDLL